MANLETKRRVMGRIDLATDSPTNSIRASTRTPPASNSNSLKRGSIVRAKVDMSAFAGVNGTTVSSSPNPLNEASSTPPASQQQYFNRPLRQATLSSLNSSPFLSASSSPAPSISPSMSTRAVSSLSNGAQSVAKAVRSPSPVRQLARNPSSLQDIHSIATLPTSNGIAPRAPRARNPSAGSGHVRMNSTQIPAPIPDISARTHAKTPSLMSPFVNVNGSNHARVATSSTLASHNSSSSLMTGSRSPSPTQTRSSIIADRRESQSSATSSAVSASSSRPPIGPTPVARISRANMISGGPVPTRPTLTTNVSSQSHSSAPSPSDIASGSLPSPSFASAMSRLVISPVQGNDGSEDTTYSRLMSPLQPAPLLSPGLELGPEAIDAKKNRKILDLEITNKSLLAINSGLEVVKLKHVHEIRDLKKKLKEGRGLGNKLGLIDDGILSDSELEAELQQDSEEDEEAPLDAELEMAHTRCKSLIDKMVEQARQAILYKYEPEVEGKGGNRVLHPVEVRMLEGDATPILAAGLSDNEDGNL